jgi:hypothetical protein
VLPPLPPRLAVGIDNGSGKNLNVDLIQYEVAFSHFLVLVDISISPGKSDIVS